MISQQALFTQMELKLHQAKAAQTEAQMREAVSALQALCNVVLDSAHSTEVMSAPTISSTNVETPTMVTAKVTRQPEAKQIDDANGASLFDF